MVSHASIRRVLPLLLAVGACGGSKKVAKHPKDTDEADVKPTPPAETEADREHKRH